MRIGIKINVLWDVEPCSLVDKYRIEEPGLSFVMSEAEGSVSTSSQYSRRYKPQERNLQLLLGFVMRLRSNQSSMLCRVCCAGSDCIELCVRIRVLHFLRWNSQRDTRLFPSAPH
jgi:hypothetical protein